MSENTTNTIIQFKLELENHRIALDMNPNNTNVKKLMFYRDEFILEKLQELKHSIELEAQQDSLSGVYQLLNETMLIAETNIAMAQAGL
ncbi:hypothetical protein [Burkholderia contaminans]|uniref:hypothetical protein n=1 Tax=Burkholderia contaminans TaxID=488447 RepID=UPI0015887F18|nr:hypothetical protein [Burkholderia contaminans]